MARTKKKVVETATPKEVEAPKAEVAVKESTAKKELIAYMEDLKRRDVHEYSVREAELNNKLKQL